MNREDKRARARDERRAERAAPASGGVPEAPVTHERTTPPQFLREVRSELRKVAWPSRREVVVYTVTVLFVTFLLVLIVWGMDYVLRQAATRFL
jgi:preprotein translocase subunit SecE